MKIIYSPFYDYGTYLGECPEEMGMIHVGNMGLLQQFEMRAGLPGVTKSDIERETAYLIELRKHIAGTVFEPAFRVDDLGTAARMLSWRDALVMAGWDASMYDGKFPKLAILAETEQGFDCPGTADRWRALYEARHNGNRGFGDQIDDIIVTCPWEEIPMLIRYVIHAVMPFGPTMAVSAPETELNIDNVSVVEFEQLADAYEWIAKAEIPEDTVIINRDNMMLNHILGTWDRPKVQSKVTRSNPQLLQLFKLGISIFSRPLNVHNLTSYLQLPINPIPGALRQKLVSQLLSEGGFGDRTDGPDGVVRDRWEQIIQDFEFVNREGNPTAQARAAKMKFIEPIRKDYSAGIPKAELADYIEALRKWVGGRISDGELPDGVRNQFSELLAQLSAFNAALAEMGDTVNYSDMEKLAFRLYHPVSYTFCQPEAGDSGKPESTALNVIQDVRCMHAWADTLVWLDCQEEDVETDPYDFLSKAEKDFLNGFKNEYYDFEGDCIPDFAAHLKRVREERMKYLASPYDIVLVKSAYNGTERLSEHPLIAEIRQMYTRKYPDRKEKLPLKDKDEVFTCRKAETETGSLDVFRPAAYVELGKIGYEGRQESNHSLDTLINFPFDYLMNYVARLPEPKDGQLQNTYITQGLVAHSFFEHVIGDSKGSLAEMRRMADEEFDCRLGAALDATGLMLRLPENTSLLKSFSVQLRESIGALIDIMDNLRLTPVGCEMQFPENADDTLELPKIGAFGARIDFLLMNEHKEYVIFDFKWSYSKSYADKLAGNMSVQLELYRKTVEAAYPGKKVAGVGYYLMPRKELATSDFDAIPGTGLINHIDAEDTGLFVQIQNSFEFRMDELRRGHVEESEMVDVMPIEDSYVSQTEALGLCPIAVKEVTNGKRGANREVLGLVKESQKIFKPSRKVRFEKKDEDPSEVATTNAILKGRLK